MGEHARAVGDLDADVERRAQLARRQRLELRQQASFWRKPVPVVPITLTMSATTADAVSIAARAGTGERDLADRVALRA